MNVVRGYFASIQQCCGETSGEGAESETLCHCQYGFLKIAKNRIGVVPIRRVRFSRRAICPSAQADAPLRLTAYPVSG
jgi:hypothetical protein